MHSRSLAGWLFLALVVMVSALFGCRAFEPETVIVNHPPETYITGAPQEGYGGQFHFHVFWCGTDQDGYVERYVWALTDSTLQDEDTDEDDEDSNFNPAEYSETLEIGHWTTRTDTVFDFVIEDGSLTSADKTFHIVAVDDRGDFDRTPARLYFFTNAIGTPEITFYGSAEQTSGTRFADYDTIGYANPFVLSWAGSTPNTQSYSAEQLAAADTMPPLDGLYGFKYRLPLDVICDEASQDCWNPATLNSETNVLESYFSDFNSLSFANDNTGSAVAYKRFSSAVHTLLVNTIDVAGVEIPAAEQTLNFVINYDPDTHILNGEEDPWYEDEDPYNPGSQRVYPYYIHTSPSGEVTTHTFVEDDRIPQRSIAVFKALGWDDTRDVRKVDLVDEDASEFEVMFQGKFDAVGLYRSNTAFSIHTLYTEAVPSVWDDYEDMTVGASDTLSFVVGPFDYTLSMRAVDEHARRDGTPDEFSFFVNTPPEIQCVEVTSDLGASGYPGDGCEARVDTLYCSSDIGDAGDYPGWLKLTRTDGLAGRIYFSATEDIVYYDEPASMDGLYSVTGFFYDYELLLYAEDEEEERLFQPRESPFGVTYGDPADRAFSWVYEIVSERDPLNLVSEGGGYDDPTQITYTFYPDDYEQNYDDNGVWRVTVEVFIPQVLQLAGEAVYRDYLASVVGESAVDHVFELTTLQMGLNTLTITNRDATDGEFRPDRCSYPYYSYVRTPEVNGEACEVIYDGMADNPRLDDYCAESAEYVKQVVVLMVQNSGSIYPSVE